MITALIRPFCMALLASACAGLQAQSALPAPGAAAPGATTTPSPGVASLTQGEIRKIDLDAGKVTLRHEAIVPLDMPAMTMSFGLKDPRLVDGLKVGDRVRFAARKEGGSYLLTHLERLQ